MTEIKQMFEASDGKTFATIEEASKHNNFIDAREGFDNAWRKLKKASIKAYKTADGYDFDDAAGHWWSERCYLITGEHSSLYPGIVEVSLYPSQIEAITVEGDEIKIHANIYIGGEGKDRSFRLSDLYKKKENAQIKLAEIFRKRIAELQNGLEALSKNNG